jgi:hypothetical protein
MFALHNNILLMTLGNKVADPDAYLCPSVERFPEPMNALIVCAYMCRLEGIAIHPSSALYQWHGPPRQGPSKISFRELSGGLMSLTERPT